MTLLSDPSGSRGFTLMELMAIAAIVSILAAISAPSLKDVYESNRLTTVLNEYGAAHRLARSEAVSRGQSVTVCVHDASDPAVPACSTGANWEDGWVVFVNEDKDSPPEIDSGETVLRVAGALDTRYTLRGRTTALEHVTYLATGDVSASGSIVLCDGGALDRARMLDVTPIGRLRIAELSADGIPLDATDTEIDACHP